MQEPKNENSWWRWKTIKPKIKCEERDQIKYMNINYAKGKNKMKTTAKGKGQDKQQREIKR